MSFLKTLTVYNTKTDSYIMRQGTVDSYKNGKQSIVLIPRMGEV